MAPKKTAAKGKDEDWEFMLDTSADTRLPPIHRILFVINSLILTAVPVYLYSSIFDLDVAENAPVYGAGSVVTAVLLTLACQGRSKSLRNRLLKSRDVELPSTSALKDAESKQDEKKLNRSKEMAQKRSEVEWEALAFALSVTNAIFLLSVVVIAFFVLRSTQPLVNYAVSTAGSGIFAFYFASRSV
mmetsp:Transcript_61859/g.145844  ORF Transcript_61859/g.145844 Transcript_61859/m.145844 type:complete len:187 (+) Transcript_61859:33-593(+)